jgi:hypothetical protein
LILNYHRYNGCWVFGVPKSEPETSYDYVKDLRYVQIDQLVFRQWYGKTNSGLRRAFVSDNGVIYQVSLDNQLTKVYQIAFVQVDENIDDFTRWLQNQLLTWEKTNEGLSFSSS